LVLLQILFTLTNTVKYGGEQMNRNLTSLYINITPAGQQIHELEYECSSNIHDIGIRQKKGRKYITLLFSSENFLHYYLYSQLCRTKAKVKLEK
jgi:hypothetical protein